MRIPYDLFAQPFRGERLGLMFVVIMTIMVYVGSIAIGAQSILARTSLSWQYNLKNRLTVELLNIPDNDSSNRQAQIEKITTQLNAIPGVKKVSAVPDQTSQALLKPWITDEALLQALPLPTLIDIDLNTDEISDVDAIKQKISEVVPDSTIHQHASWMAKLLGFLGWLGIIAQFMIVLTAIAMVAVIHIICLTAITTARSTVELLHFMGATDKAIAREFLRHFVVLGIKSALLGYFLAFLTSAGLLWLLQSVDGLSLIADESWVTLGSVTSFVPLSAIVIAIISAHLSIMRLLRRMQ